jgi:peptidoglycan/xylan/chitin deacetylase (PgdA/CDA1 family)
MELLTVHNKVITTLFTTANFANHFPNVIRQLGTKHEIASHTYYHSQFTEADLLSSKLALEAISGQKVTGLRMPRLRPVNMQAVAAAGYSYDSSINPTWLPGRYNNLHLPRRIYMDNGMLRVPASVSANLRIPLFWLSFKNFPYAIYKKMAIEALKKDGYLCLYFHPWEFTNLEKYAIPAYAKKHHGKVLQDKLHLLLKDLALESDFCSMQQYVNGWEGKQ